MLCIQVLFSCILRINFYFFFQFVNHGEGERVYVEKKHVFHNNSAITLKKRNIVNI